MSRKSFSHNRLLSEDDEASSLSHDMPEKDYDDDHAAVRRKLWVLRVSWGLQMILFVVSVLMLYLSINRTPTNLQCSNQMSTYSPILEVDGLIQYSTFNLPLNFREPSPYRGPPTPEREALWQKLWYLGGINVPEDKLPLMNKSTEEKHYKHTSPSRGGGIVGYPEVFHRLHCLAILRSQSYKDHYGTDPLLPMPEYLAQDPEVVRDHIDHCLDLLRWSLMCASDVTTFLVEEEEDPTSPFGLRADFETNHKCRDFWKIHEWVGENAAFP